MKCISKAGKQHGWFLYSLHVNFYVKLCVCRNVVMADDGSLPEPAPPAPLDSRLPLDARQVFKLKKSWKGIKRHMEATGLEMFVR